MFGQVTRDRDGRRFSRPCISPTKRPGHNVDHGTEQCNARAMGPTFFGRMGRCQPSPASQPPTKTPPERNHSMRSCSAFFVLPPRASSASPGIACIREYANVTTHNPAHERVSKMERRIERWTRRSSRLIAPAMMSLRAPTHCSSIPVTIPGQPDAMGEPEGLMR